MKQRYLPAFALLLLGFSAQAQSTAWRPFRPGPINFFRWANAGNGTPQLFSFRVDSAYASGGDSVYTFNRLLRDVNGTSVVKSRNNLFGARLRWQPGAGQRAEYTLETVAEPGIGGSASLTLRPQAPVGSTWPANPVFSTTVTLISRTWQLVPPTAAGIFDSVATFRINTSPIPSPTSPIIKLSRNGGLLEGPQWLNPGATGVPAPAQIQRAMAPVGREQSPYSSQLLFDVFPGDEFGYLDEDYMSSSNGFPFVCYRNYLLRRVLSRRLTADSLIIGYQEQSRNVRTGMGPTCGPASSTLSGIVQRRWVVALRPGPWRPTAGALQVETLGLLTYEYAPVLNSSGNFVHLMVGMPLGESNSYLTNNGLMQYPSFAPYYTQGNSFYPGFDLMQWRHSFGPGLSKTSEVQWQLKYVRKVAPNSSQVRTAGNIADYAGLLSTRAEQATAVATLAPNPAGETAQLTLSQPAPAGTVLRLTDALGRPVWQQAVSPGQRVLPVSCAGLPTGLYLLQLSRPDAAPGTWRLTHE